MIFVGYSLIALSLILFLSSSLFLLRVKDFFSMIQPLKIFGFYGLPVFLIGFLMTKFSLSLLVKVMILVVMSIVLTIMVMRLLIEYAIKDKVKLDGKFKNLVRKKK